MPLDSPEASAPTPVRSRRQAAASVVLLAAAAGLALLLLELRARRGALEALAAAACRGDAAAATRLRSYLLVVLGLVPASAVALAGYVALLARRVRREGVFPPPGTWMIRPPARTFTGVAARRCAAVMLGFSATLAALAALLTAIGLRMLALLDR